MDAEVLALAAEVQAMGLSVTFGGEVMSKAMSIDWHKQCLKNHKWALERYEEELLNLQKRVRREVEEFLLYETQIYEAEKAHKDKFDRSRYLSPKVKK